MKQVLKLQVFILNVFFRRMTVIFYHFKNEGKSNAKDALGDFCPLFAKFLEWKEKSSVKRSLNTNKNTHVRTKKLFDFLQRKNFEILDETFFEKGRKQLMEDFFVSASATLKSNTMVQYLHTLKSFFSFFLELEGVKKIATRKRNLKEILGIIEDRVVELNQEKKRKMESDFEREEKSPKKKHKKEKSPTKSKEEKLASPSKEVNSI